MRVAIDGRRLQDTPYTGVGRRVANLLPYLAESVEIVLLTDARRDSPGLDDYEEVRLSVPPKLPEPFWLQFSVARWLRHFDGVFHGNYNAVPLFSGARSVVTLHDLSFEHHREDMSAATALSFRWAARGSARRAGAVIAVSEFVRQDIIATYDVPPARVLTARPAIDPLFGPERAEAMGPLRERYGIDGPYVVALGGARRRGLAVAVEAWRRLPAPDRPMLVVVGAEVPPPHKGLVHIGRVPDDEWSAVLAGATVFCYPTRFEGYGMPASEAAASGVAVVCARQGPLPEVLGDAAEWCATPSVEDITAGLAHLLSDDAHRRALAAAGLARAAAAPGWADCAAVELAAYALAAS